jgi:hypothetical protein
MTKGKPWTVEEEKQLSELVKAGRSAREVAEKMGKSFSSVRNKIDNLGLKDNNTVSTEPALLSSHTSALELPKDLPSVEEALKMLVDARARIE